MNLYKKMTGVVLSCFLLAGCSSQSAIRYSEWQLFPTYQISPAIQKLQDSIKDYHRPEAATYLIFPEWYIVYSSQEYADFLAKNPPSEFPYFSSIAQYWWSDSAVNHMTQNRYPYDYGDHLMLGVIGTSFSLEYFIKGIYENSIGRLTEWSAGFKKTPEDCYAQKVAAEYAEFIPVYPWYDFSYAKSLKGLWQQTPLFGENMIRKWERKFILSLEYSFKILYSSIIAGGTHLTYGNESSYTYALTAKTPKNLFQNTKVLNVKKISEDQSIIAIPNEQLFTDSLKNLVHSEIKFNNIAGNNEILVSSVAPKQWTYDYKYGQLLFTMNILTQPNYYRFAVRLPVAFLMDYLRYLHQHNLPIEHIYDY